jgi:hypothetical protein
MRGLVASFVLALAACTAPNLAYMAFDDAAGEAGSTADGTGTVTSTGEGAGSESSAEPMECQMHPPRSIELTVAMEGGEPWEPECPDGQGHVVGIALGRNMFPPGSIEHQLCDPGVCPCPLDSPLLRIGLGDLVFAEGVPLPDCSRVDLWTRMGPRGCEWAGVMLTPPGSALPDFMAANELSVAPLYFIQGQPLTLALVDEGACRGHDACDDGRLPGHHALDVLGQAVVTVDASPRDIDIAFLMGGATETYVFDNRESSVTLECEPRVSWTAQRRP